MPIKKEDMQEKFFQDLKNRYQYGFGIHKYDFRVSEKEIVKEIIDSSKKLTTLEWKDILEKNNSPMVKYALLSHPKIPIDIAEQITKEILNNFNKKNPLFTDKKILLKALEKDINASIKTNIIKVMRKPICEYLSTHELSKDSPYSHVEYKTCPYDTATLKLMCESWLASQQVQKMNNWGSPFRFIDDEEYILKQVMNNPKTAENTYTAIANNVNLSNEIRLEAAQRGSVVDVYFPTPEIQDFVFDYLTPAYKEFLLTKNQELRSVQNVFCQKFSLDFFDVEHQKKFVDLIYNTVGEKPRSDVLSTLYIRTNSTEILNTCLLFKTASAKSAYRNPNMDKEKVDKYLEDLTTQMNKKLTFFKRNNVDVSNLSTLVRTRTLPNDCYKAILKHQDRGMIRDCAESFYTPIEILDDITKIQLPVIRYQNSYSPVYTSKSLNFISLLNKIIRQNTDDKEEFEKLHRSLATFSIPRTLDTTENNDTPSVLSGNITQDIDKYLYSFQSLASILHSSTASKLFEIEKDINEAINDPSTPSFLITPLKDLVQIIDISSKLSKANLAQNCEWCSDKTLNDIKARILTDFFNEFYFSPLDFYNFFDEYFKQYERIENIVIERETIKQNNERENSISL